MSARSCPSAPPPGVLTLRRSSARGADYRLTKKRWRWGDGAAPHRPAATAASRPTAADVAIVGAGIIGLCTALELQRGDSALRVVLLDARVPCSGATGAGQGYLWLAHRVPGGPLFEVATRSTRLWRELLEAGAQHGLDPVALEWQGIGSLLLASNAGESEQLRAREAALRSVSVDARWVPAAELAALEPALAVAPDGAALLVPSDAQINGRTTAAALLAACEAHGSRFSALFHEPAAALVAGPSGRIQGVETAAGRTFLAPAGIVVAAGAWSGDWLAAQLGQESWRAAFAPRKGLLLELPRPNGMPPLRTGMMEAGYTRHYAGGGASTAEAAPGRGGRADITFTATTAASGKLLVGSSREFSGYDMDPDEGVVESIMTRAAVFLPHLGRMRREDIAVRAGPRPYAAAGVPMVGCVPGAEGLLLAAGHEGAGLTLGPATAELLADAILGRTPQLSQAAVDVLAPKQPELS